MTVLRWLAGRWRALGRAIRRARVPLTDAEDRARMDRYWP